MKCEHCGKNEVTFVYQSNINGKVTEKHLCGECAEKLGYSRHLAARSASLMRGMLGGSLFHDFFSPMPGLLGSRGWMLEDPFADFFADMPVLAPGQPEKQAQPEQKQDLLEKEEQARFEKMRRLNALRMEQKKAIREENFERAAELRDQIRALEQEEQ